MLVGQAWSRAGVSFGSVVGKQKPDSFKSQFFILNGNMLQREISKAFPLHVSDSVAGPLPEQCGSGPLQWPFSWQLSDDSPMSWRSPEQE